MNLLEELQKYTLEENRFVIDSKVKLTTFYLKLLKDLDLSGKLSDADIKEPLGFVTFPNKNNDTVI